MHPFLFEIFGFKVYTYGMVMVLAFVICFWLIMTKRPKDLLSVQDIYNLCLLGLTSLLFAPKIMNILMHKDFTPPVLLNGLKFWERGGFSFVPVFLMAVLCLTFYSWIKKIPIFKLMDALLPVAILGISIQRLLGCFLAGCCYGGPTDLPWGTVFPSACQAGRHFPGAPLHPTQLYYGITSLLIFFLLTGYRKHHPKDGEISALGFMALGVSYFFITYLRGDIMIHQKIHHLSHTQILAATLFYGGLSIYVFVKRRETKKPLKRTAALDICPPINPEGG